MSYRPEGLDADTIYDSVKTYVSATELIDYTIDYVIEYLKNQPTTIKHPDEWIVFIPDK